jgi:branched-chain amino acid transport system substrate-binding protein
VNRGLRNRGLLSGVCVPAIKVGLVCTCSGSVFGSALIPAKDVYQAWVDSVNAGGGINGHPVKLIAEDDAGNLGNAVTDIQTLI